jgi:uncharacterized protein YjbI with pentapeptide repeats
MSAEIWNELIHGKPLSRPGVPKVDGRVDLRNLHVSEPHALETVRTPLADVTVLGGFTSVENATWHSIDFSSSQLPGLRFLDCQIRDCVFDRCRMDDLRVWRTDFANVSFRSADLRGAVLGGTSENDNRRNSFHDVDFTAADMRGTIYGAAEFLRCTFNRAKLSRIDFQSSTFTDCSFEGELREVMFWDRGFKGELFPPNEMKRVDFTRAKLRWSGFHRLDLEEVLLPTDEDHIVVENFPEVLDRLLAFLHGRPDVRSSALAAIFEHRKEWLGAKQKVGVLNKRDLIETAGEEGLQAVMKVIGSARRAPER